MRNTIDNHLIDLVLTCLAQVRSEHGRTVAQEWDDVPLEEWEANAKEIIKIIGKEYKRGVRLTKPEINISRMLQDIESRGGNDD